MDQMEGRVEKWQHKPFKDELNVASSVSVAKRSLHLFFSCILWTGLSCWCRVECAPQACNDATGDGPGLCSGRLALVVGKRTKDPKKGAVSVATKFHRGEASHLRGVGGSKLAV